MFKLIMFEKCIYFNSNALVRQINKIWDDAFKPFGLSPSHAYVLRLVLNTPGLSMKQIAEDLELAPSTVTRFVDNLIHKDFLKRISANDDKRSTRIHPSQRAKKIHKALETTGQTLYAQLNKTLGEKDFATLVTHMRETRQQLP
ncbi:hypothetical protein MNBD_GAMMA07-577 [hydrothermal vent metagenome]|uniref:HTH marR-type domain-containing protein n=1 Tax=hydrothermal vent metagenome TaxID=652676 RepID=A0A3B0WK35_9ZZZZ